MLNIIVFFFFLFCLSVNEGFVDTFMFLDVWRIVTEGSKCLTSVIFFNLIISGH